MEPIDYSVGETANVPPSPSATPRVDTSILVPNDLHLTPASVDNRTPRKKSSRKLRPPLNNDSIIVGNTTPSKAQVHRLQNEVWLLKKKWSIQEVNRVKNFYLIKLTIWPFLKTEEIMNIKYFNNYIFLLKDSDILFIKNLCLHCLFKNDELTATITTIICFN